MSSQDTGDVVPSTEIEHQPTTVDPSGPQQASSPPNKIPANQIKKPSEVDRNDPNINVVELPPQSPTFKERVYGYARLIRGTVLGRPGVKEQGEQVLRGEQGIPLRGSPSSREG